MVLEETSAANCGLPVCDKIWRKLLASRVLPLMALVSRFCKLVLFKLASLTVDFKMLFKLELSNWPLVSVWVSKFPSSLLLVLLAMAWLRICLRSPDEKEPL